MRHHTNQHRSRRKTISITAASATVLAVVAATAAVQSNAFGTEERATVASQAETQAQECGAGKFQAEVAKTGNTWKARHGDTVLYTGDDMFAAMNAGLDSLTPHRTTKERMVVLGSGTISASERLKLPSYTILDVCGTINATGAVATDTGPIYSRDTTDVEVQHAKITGAPMYGMFFRSVSNLTLGQIDMRLSGGLGIRIDNGSKTTPATNTRIDNVYVSGASSNAVETAGLDGVTIGTVTARDVGEAGLLLNTTTNAEVGTVDADNVGAGTGYAAFRMANRNGRIGDSYETNIHVEEVIARGGGRGIFCVSESGGAVIDRVDIADTGNNAILVENCYNVTIAAEGGTVSGAGGIRIAARDEFANTSDVTLENLTVTDSFIKESPCAENTVIKNVELVNTTKDVC
ncbi:right-handed parallel beta-helix repeat-containing protein [Streptomyces sp. NBC_00059]|uniref:right-handed parallel beta-helix repeat-containing protein n=1 Tax=Streptomyces sp. NBC_00059 TaxID=2975635 RepID=UPI002254DF81|nr:right-handed parallel beta-helix repeat-containing protein [Streptomyces sp. NBC_00059]MCX5415954.1 right-handed parallel beta-helix repeat-containing protein [Streptomyces sp. NBC_00059]